MSVFGLKNSLRIGFSSRRISRTARDSSRRVCVSSNAYVGGGGPPLADVETARPGPTESPWGRGTFELDRRQLLNLLLGVVHAALFLNARPNLAHDLLDVDGIGANVELGHKERRRNTEDRIQKTEQDCSSAIHQSKPQR